LQIGPELYTNLPDKNSTLAIDPLAGEAARLRPILASRRRSRPGKQLGSVRGSPRATSDQRWGGGTASEVGRRRPGAVTAAARGNRRGRRCLDKKRTGKVHWGLVRLLERLAGGERERAHELKAAAAMARWSSGWRAAGKKGRLF
jgi:hypothetical protein